MGDKDKPNGGFIPIFKKKDKKPVVLEGIKNKEFISMEDLLKKK